MPLPIRLVVVSCPPTIVTMMLAITSSSVSRSPSTSASTSALISPSRGVRACSRIARAEIVGHLVDALEHPADAVGVVLEIAEHLGEVCDQALSWA